MKEILTPRIFSLCIGYFFGCFLAAEAVTRKITGKPCSELGESGNPGMANVMANLGFRPGILVLAGDLLKTLLAVLLSVLLFGSHGLILRCGRIVTGYAALGTTLGHNYPFWMKFRGGKGVATSCAGYFLIDPLSGLLSMISGMLIVFATGYLGLGAAAISLIYIPFAFWRCDVETGILALILAVLMLIRHAPAIYGISSGKTNRVDVLGAIRRKFFDN